jgi:hypothetical protein
MFETKFVKETFWNLLKKSGGIVIPIIQRAYTQGGRGTRGNEDQRVKKTGEAFIDCLVVALLEDKPIELDFIYGTTESEKIQPLDGQQRLTTLFLLHWYLALKEGVLDVEIKETLKKFSYETRMSSRNFCDELCENGINMTEAGDEFHNVVENQTWFLFSWKNDPSVLSMLGMLEMIHKRLGGKPNGLWSKLIQEPPIAPITFFYTPLESFGLTDDLYIKMNARGKELTLFEKFKAAIEKKIDDNGWDDSISIDKKFGIKMDTEWTDLFWKFHDKNYQIDRYVLRFFSAILIGYYSGKNDKDTAVQLFSNPEDISPDILDKDAYNYLYNTIDFFSIGNLALTKEINDADFWWGDKADNLRMFADFFKLFVYYDKQGQMTWQQHALFYGFSLYLEKISQDLNNNPMDWLRFIRNIITNGTIDDYAPFISAKKRLDELKQYSGNIYANLDLIDSSSGFAGRQMKEEIQKAKIYKNSFAAKSIIQEIENCNFCRGRVEFVLSCLEINDKVNDITMLNKIKNVLYEHLNDDDISNDFRKALLTITKNDDDGFYNYWQNYCHGYDATSKGQGNYTITGQQYCLIIGNGSRGSEDKTNIQSLAYHQEYGGILKVLILKMLDGKTLKDLLKLENLPQMPEWKQEFITKTDWEKDNGFRFIVLADGENTGKVYTRKTKKAWYPQEIM